jgi:hypothetical protein
VRISTAVIFLLLLHCRLKRSTDLRFALSLWLSRSRKPRLELMCTIQYWHLIPMPCLDRTLGCLGQSGYILYIEGSEIFLTWS